MDRLIAKLTREEKIALVSGAGQWHTAAIPRLGIPSIQMCDGPHGLRIPAGKGDHLGIGESLPATCFPTAATTANSWDPDLLWAMGKAMGEEALEAGISVVLGPGINVKRSPLCGRNFEYFSEDPHLTGELAAAWIKGLQSVGIGASLKHFAANNQEKWRMLNDSLVDERALREIYLAAFEKAVREAQPWTVMAAYNKVNGTYACENATLLTDILRKEWGFQGAVISDWGAVNDPGLSIKAGLDLEMPASHGVSAAKLRKDLSTGRLTEAELNKAVRRVLDLVFKGEANKRRAECDLEAHHGLAREIAAQSAVLLKNEGGILPLKRGQKIAVLGQFAVQPRYQGAGSSLINPTKLETVVEELNREGIQFEYAPGYSLDSGEVDEELLAEACAQAEASEVVLIFAGLPAQYESEGYDRENLDLPPNHNALIERVSQVNPNVIVILSAGSPTTLPWLEQVRAVLHTYLGGQGGAGAAVDILFGKVNPSGKLAESYPLKLEDCPAQVTFARERSQTKYGESIFVGYRYYDAAQKEVLFPFGFGLSYTTFSYEGMELSAQRIRDTDSLTVRCTIKNVGERGGAEVIQLYVGKRESVLFRAPKELKGFAKVFLEPGEAKTVEFELAGRSFAFYNAQTQCWQVEEGEYEILVGASSRDLPLGAKVYVETSRPELAVPDYRSQAPGYYNLPLAGAEISEADFRAVYGREFPLPVLPGPPFHENSTLEDLQQTRIGRLVLKFAKRYLQQETGLSDEADPTWLMTWRGTLELPLRSIVALSGGRIPEHLVQGLLAWANGRRGKALRIWLGWE